MTIYILGSGVLGNYLHSHLSPSHESVLLPGRHICSSPDSFPKLQPTDYIVELLDPASFDSAHSDLYATLLLIRQQIIKSSIAKYIYISSASVYQVSDQPLTEESILVASHNRSSSYVQHKLLHERIVSSCSTSPIAIARLPNLWSSVPSENKGFFLDLYKSYSSHTILPPRQGDELVFSYMSYLSATYSLAKLLVSSLSGIVNLPSNTYSSRFALKHRLKPPELPTAGRILTSLKYSKLESSSPKMQDSWLYRESR